METKTIHQRLLEAQKEIGVIKKDKDNPFFHSKYADINSLLAVVKPVLNRHGLVISQALTTQDGKLALGTALICENGDTLGWHVAILPEVADAQKAGSAITYFRRYALQSLLALEAEDDDGNVASRKKVEKAEEKVDYNKPPFEEKLRRESAMEADIELGNDPMGL